jgi:tetratricopeptide (TPR) repeat protein
MRHVHDGEEAYDACIDRARAAAQRWEVRMERERERRDRRLALVRSKGWEGLSRAERRSIQRGWAGVEALLCLSFEERYRDPRKMLYFAERAQALSDRLGPSFHGETALRDLRARVLAEVANANRVNENFEDAEEAIAKARALLDESNSDPMVRAFINEVEASFLKDQRRLSEAEALLNRVYRNYLRLGERHLAGRALTTKGIILRIAGRPDEAVLPLRHALELLNDDRDPQLMAAAHHNLFDALTDAGKFSEAGQLLLESGLRQKFADDPLNLLRLRWVEGKIMAGRGRYRDAERIFSEVRAGFLERGLGFVAAVAGTDLAKALLKQAKMKELYKLSHQLYDTARDGKIHKEAQKALLGFEVCCRHGVATEPVVDRLRSFLNRLEHDSDLEFQPDVLVSA